jgi:hypothetical protein
MKKIFYFIFGAILLITCLVLYKKDLFLYPSFIHAWTQSDRYALSLCFLENGFDLFHPCTFHYNTQLHSRITAVDLPLNEFIVAFLMKITGSTSPFIFRLYTLLYSLVGLFFLYKLTVQLSRSVYKGIFIVVFAFFSPVYFYYQISFLPSVPSIASVFIGLYFCFQYYESENRKNLLTGIVFLTLAALYRFPFIIFLLAIASAQALSYYKNRKIIWQEVAPGALAILSVLGYFLYNLFLRNKYGSVFLGHTLPASSIKEFSEIVKISLTHWIFHYFTIYHYIVLLILTITFIYTKGFSSLNFLSKKFSHFLLISLIGTTIYATLMIQQFQHHDYYFLDTFFIFTVLIAMFLFYNININNFNFYLGYQSVLFILLLLIILACLKTHTIRTTVYSWDLAYAEKEDYTGSDELLRSAGIPESAKMLVLGSATTSMPFILMKRTGYAPMNNQRDSLIKSLELNYDYVVMQNNSMYNEVLVHYPEIINQLIKVADNGKISVYKKSPATSEISMMDFLGFTNTSLKKKILVDYDPLSTDPYIKIMGEPSDSLFHSSPRSYCLTGEYGMTFVLTEKFTQSSCYFEGYFNTNSSVENFHLVVSVTDSLSNNLSYATFPIGEFLQKKNEWIKVSYTFKLPPLGDGEKTTIFLHNPDQKKIFNDDLLLLIR